MKIRGQENLSDTPWYVAGLAFECSQCGRCCAGPEEGYVWVTGDDINGIAKYLSIPLQQVKDNYIREVAGRVSLVEQENNDCIFLVPDPANPKSKTCMVYPVRPIQCRTWPFWASNVKSPRAWNSAAKRCDGINRGKSFSLEQINERIKKTIE